MNTRTGAPTSPLQRLREQAGLTQQEVADAVNVAAGQPDCGPVTAGQVSRWERGHGVSRRYQRALATVYRVTITDLQIGWTPPQPRSVLAFLDEEPAISTADPRVTRSREEWVTTRRHLNTYRQALTRVAAAVYPPGVRLDDTGLLLGEGWTPDQPVPLDQVCLDHEPEGWAPAVDGGEPQAATTRPLIDLTHAYPRYSAAVRDLNPPRLFENKMCWQLTGVDWGTGKGRLRFGTTTYFAGMDVCETLAHETAYVCLDADGQPQERTPTLRDLPFRRLVGDPFRPAGRTTLTAMSTLTIRNGDEPAFLLHRRDSRMVAVAGGMLHVIPSGIFQPSSVLPAAVDADFDLWRNVMRELSEELLGFVEANGDGQPVDYAAPPFGGLQSAYNTGRIRVWALGVGLDALTLAQEILTVAVVDPDVFDDLARDFVEVNAEGTVVGERLPFDEPTVSALLESGRMAPAGAGCLSLAWQHRNALLG